MRYTLLILYVLLALFILLAACANIVSITIAAWKYILS